MMRALDGGAEHGGPELIVRQREPWPGRFAASLRLRLAPSACSDIGLQSPHDGWIEEDRLGLVSGILCIAGRHSQQVQAYCDYELQTKIWHCFSSAKMEAAASHRST